MAIHKFPSLLNGPTTENAFPLLFLISRLHRSTMLLPKKLPRCCMERPISSSSNRSKDFSLSGSFESLAPKLFGIDEASGKTVPEL